jgi:uncharacterized MAPEG superfamily protein
LKGRISSQVWDKLARARGAHLNAMEGIPMFAAAMVSFFTTLDIIFWKSNVVLLYSWPVIWQTFRQKT